MKSNRVWRTQESRGKGHAPRETRPPSIDISKSRLIMFNLTSAIYSLMHLQFYYGFTTNPIRGCDFDMTSVWFESVFHSFFYSFWCCFDMVLTCFRNVAISQGETGGLTWISPCTEKLSSMGTSDRAGSASRGVSSNLSSVCLLKQVLLQPSKTSVWWTAVLSGVTMAASERQKQMQQEGQPGNMCDHITKEKTVAWVNFLTIHAANE